MFVRNYYSRSILIVVLAAASTFGCASASSVAASAPVVKYASFARDAGKSNWQRPVVLAFVPGDRIPIDFDLDSTLVTRRGPSRVDLEVTRPFFMLIRPDGPPKVSLDGKDFDENHRGYFRAGIGADKDADVHATLTLGFLPKARPGH